MIWEVAIDTTRGVLLLLFVLVDLDGTTPAAPRLGLVDFVRFVRLRYMFRIWVRVWRMRVVVWLGRIVGHLGLKVLRLMVRRLRRCGSWRR